MTKKKAIEAACDVPDAEVEALCPEGTWCKWIGTRNKIIAERAYEAGRIAGRKETIAQLPDAGLIRAWDAKRKLRRYANALAKKARAK